MDKGVWQWGLNICMKLLQNGFQWPVLLFSVLSTIHTLNISLASSQTQQKEGELNKLRSDLEAKTRELQVAQNFATQLKQNVSKQIADFTKRLGRCICLNPCVHYCLESFHWYAVSAAYRGW